MAAYDPGPRDGAGSLPSRGRTQAETHAFEVIELEPKVMRRTEPRYRPPQAERRERAWTFAGWAATAAFTLLAAIFAAVLWKVLGGML